MVDNLHMLNLVLQRMRLKAVTGFIQVFKADSPVVHFQRVLMSLVSHKFQDPPH